MLSILDPVQIRFKPGSKRVDKQLTNTPNWTRHSESKGFTGTRFKTGSNRIQTGFQPSLLGLQLTPYKTQRFHPIYIYIYTPVYIYVSTTNIYICIKILIYCANGPHGSRGAHWPSILLFEVPTDTMLILQKEKDTAWDR